MGIGSWGLGKKRMGRWGDGEMGGRRELGIGSWGLGKKRMGRWGDRRRRELEIGSWELGEEGKSAIILDIYSALLRRS
uniref:Uncharacterized protein n=1 Tax=Desertifilum tharense IPPAS B-1220 TaxID=1781255 RepID=A0ACD5GQJ5_9CYAN